MTKFKKDNVRLSFLPKLNQGCRDLNAFRCGEDCSICFGYDGDNYSCYSYETYYDDDDMSNIEGEYREEECPLTFNITTVSQNFNLTDSKEWPALPSTTVRRSSTVVDKVVVEVAELETENSSFATDEHSSWHDITSPAEDSLSSSCNDWDIVSDVESIQTIRSDSNSDAPSQQLLSTETLASGIDAQPQRNSICHDMQQCCDSQSRTINKTGYYDEDSDDGVPSLDSFRDGIKNLRGGKKKFMFKGDPKRPFTVLPTCCRDCDWINKKQIDVARRKQKRDLRWFCSEMMEYQISRYKLR